MSDRPLTYVEGVGHAWAVDPEGGVLEFTFHADLAEWFASHLGYFGVPYRKEWLRRQVDKWGGFMGSNGSTFPSLQYLVFAPEGWEALAAGRTTSELGI